jgi:class 3 adenylate cyclase
MLRRSLVVREAEPAEALSFRRAPSVWDRLAPGHGRRWSTALTNFISGRSGYASRLMVAVHTDMVGYSRLFDLDDVGTVARLRDLRRHVAAPAIRRHGGRLVQTAGDSMLIMFDSVTEAVRSAVTIQRELAAGNDHWPFDRWMRLRIGVDLGDVFVDGRDLHGDGVIVAARLQALCPPGGVCISRAVHERGGARLDLPCESLGPLRLKNVARPVEAFVLWPTRDGLATEARLADWTSGVAVSGR